MPSKKLNNDQLITRDWLAIERTRLANERTFLSYLRTAIGFLAAGITVLKIELFSSLIGMGWVMTILSPLIFLFALFRVIRVAKKIETYYVMEQTMKKKGSAT